MAGTQTKSFAKTHPLKRALLMAEGFAAFMLVWCTGCWLADFAFHLPANAWRMWFGYVVGSAALYLSARVAGRSH